MDSLVFFGSGPVAAKSLVLLAKDFDIEAVITKPKPQHHRGEFPVVQLAEQLGLKTLTPANKQELSQLFSSKPVTSHLGVVIDYGIIISKDVIDYFPLGIVNSHFSLLPRWRGADPITFAVLSGDTKSGVSLMLIDEGMDTGKLITQKTHHLSTDTTSPDLTDELIDLSHSLLVEYLPRYIQGDIHPHAQPHPDRATYSRKLTKKDGIIDWAKSAEIIEREIRAFLGWPGSRTTLAGKDVIITKAHVANRLSETREESSNPGTIIIEQKEIMIVTGKDLLAIEKLKPAGKSEMTSEGFLAGYGKNL